MGWDNIGQFSLSSAMSSHCAVGMSVSCLDVNEVVTCSVTSYNIVVGRGQGHNKCEVHFFSIIDTE